jgi:hypothetical protein
LAAVARSAGTSAPSPAERKEQRIIRSFRRAPNHSTATAFMGATTSRSLQYMGDTYVTTWVIDRRRAPTIPLCPGWTKTPCIHASDSSRPCGITAPPPAPRDQTLDATLALLPNPELSQPHFCLTSDDPSTGAVNSKQHTRRTAPSQEVTCIKGGYFLFSSRRKG